jgi:uncharacterized damage-inducible protein DinB
MLDLISSTPFTTPPVNGEMQITSLIVRMFEHNLWANTRAMEVCADLPDALLDATVQGTGGSVRETLMHITGAEQRYVMRLSGRPTTFGEHDGWPGVAALAEAVGESGQLLIDFAATADPEGVLEGEYQGQVVTLPVAIMYVQAINHATEHRSQIATILSQQGIEAPDFSGWAWRDTL